MKKNGQVTVIPCVQVLGEIAAYIRRYLVCDDHQLTLLTLWAACTQCHHHFLTAPYFHIRSPQPHSGRSLCLNLLCDLSNADICYTGIPSAPLLHRLLQGRSLDSVRSSGFLPPFPVLIDDYHHTFGRSDRQPLICLLASGFEATSFFSRGAKDFTLFGPKAFAGNAPLPRSLAARCIAINLRRPRPSETFVRYWSEDRSEHLKNLRSRLARWLEQVSPALAQAGRNGPPDLPPLLSPAQGRCAESLLHIADAAGGAWPARVRAALVAVSDLAEAAPELQMLYDIRAIFRDCDNPEYLSTGDLLTRLRALDTRPWSAWSSKSGRRLVNLLRPFSIASGRLHYGSGDDFMGYLLEDFQDAWQRYLPSSEPQLERVRVDALSNVQALQPAAVASPSTQLCAMGAE